MKERYDLEINKEDFIEVMKYLLTADQETFEKDLKGKYKVVPELRKVRITIKGFFEDCDYCLLDEPKHYKSLLNTSLYSLYRLIEKNDEWAAANKCARDILYWLDRNEANLMDELNERIWK